MKKQKQAKVYSYKKAKKLRKKIFLYVMKLARKHYTIKDHFYNWDKKPLNEILAPKIYKKHIFSKKYFRPYFKNATEFRRMFIKKVNKKYKINFSFAEYEHNVTFSRIVADIITLYMQKLGYLE